MMRPPAAVIPGRLGPGLPSAKLSPGVTDAALAGAHVATIPTKVFDQMLKHPLTDKGIESFLADWKKSGR